MALEHIDLFFQIINGPVPYGTEAYSPEAYCLGPQVGTKISQKLILIARDVNSSSHLTFLSECLLTIVALMRFLSCVYQVMLRYRRVASKCLITDLTRVVGFKRRHPNLMHLFMLFHLTSARECFVAVLACMGFDETFVSCFVRVPVACLSEGFIADTALVGVEDRCG